MLTESGICQLSVLAQEHRDMVIIRNGQQRGTKLRRKLFKFAEKDLQKCEKANFKERK
jgi:hypothetical protein